MKRTIGRQTNLSYRILNGLSTRAALLLAIAGASLHAQESRGCTTEWIRGAYGYTIAGLRPTAAPGQSEQVFAVGVRIFNGTGEFTQAQTEKGSLTAAPVVSQASGTYVVNPDCTGTATIAGGAQAYFVIVDNGKQINWIVTSPPALTITGHAVRQ